MKVTTVCGRLIAVTAVLFLFVAPASAQDDDEGPTKWGEDAKYVSVTYVKFKPGKREEGMEIIAEHFKPASEKAGLPGPVMIIHFQTGKWDAVYAWDLEGGMADLEWYRSPDDIKWYEALAELNGGAEAAGEIMAQWSAAVADSLTQIGHYHTGEEE